MSISFYDTINKNKLICRLTIDSIINFSSEYGLQSKKNSSQLIFEFPWIMFLKMVRHCDPHGTQNHQFSFIQIEDSLRHDVYLILSVPNKPLYLSEKSGIIAASDTDLLIRDEQIVTVIFEGKTIESFGKNELKHFPKIFILILLVIILLMICVTKRV